MLNSSANISTSFRKSFLFQASSQYSIRGYISTIYVLHFFSQPLSPRTACSEHRFHSLRKPNPLAMIVSSPLHSSARQCIPFPTRVRLLQAVSEYETWAEWIEIHEYGILRLKHALDILARWDEEDEWHVRTDCLRELSIQPESVFGT